MKSRYWKPIYLNLPLLRHPISLTLPHLPPRAHPQTFKPMLVTPRMITIMIVIMEISEEIAATIMAHTIAILAILANGARFTKALNMMNLNAELSKML